VSPRCRSGGGRSPDPGDLKAGNGTPGSTTPDHLHRRPFFGTSSSLGQHPIAQEVQTAALCLGFGGGAVPRPKVPCVENRRWSFHGVTYATVNVQGSCNNLCDTAPDPDEYAARNAADIQWLKDTFAEATADGSAAVMIVGQADPGFDKSDVTRAPLRDPQTLAETDGQPDGFKDFLTALRDQAVAFRRPVAYVHGDSHYFRVDKPLQDAQGRRVENFTRVETYGDNQNNGLNDVHWLKVLVDPGSRDVFAFQPQVVPANRVAVPAPSPVGWARRHRSAARPADRHPGGTIATGFSTGLGSQRWPMTPKRSAGCTCASEEP
jgi:hypothetical protein